MENEIKIENFTFHRYNFRYYFVEKISGIEGEIIMGSGDFGRGKSETHEPTDAEIETIELLFEENLDLILNAEKI